MNAANKTTIATMDTDPLKLSSKIANNIAIIIVGII